MIAAGLAPIATLGADGFDSPPAAMALRRQLADLRHVIAGLTRETYQAAPSRVSGSIGAHVRHCLDHVRALVEHRADRPMSYDARLRGTRVETEPGDALAEIARLSRRLEEFTHARLSEPVRLDSLTDRSSPPCEVGTTVGRELAFVVQHTIHHAAIISVLLERAGCALPADFGYAPSTPRVRPAAAPR